MADRKENVVTSGDGDPLTNNDSEDGIQPEKFPGFPQHHKVTAQKSKSLTAAEMEAELLATEDLTATIERLKKEQPPPSLEQVRVRRASIKEQRRETINLIRSRTASRASASSRPSLEEISKGGQSG